MLHLSGAYKRQHPDATLRTVLFHSVATSSQWSQMLAATNEKHDLITKHLILHIFKFLR